MKKNLRYFFCLTALLLFVLETRSQTSVSESIRLNQLGFYPDAPKIAVIKTNDFKKYSIITADKKKQVYNGILKTSVLPALNGKETSIADFSAFKQEGSYVLFVEGLGFSSIFNIKNDVFKDLGASAIKAFYYQRASTSLPKKYAGKWARNEGHPDDKVLIHPSATTKQRPKDTIISAPKGWYDAGDYNKYIVNSGVTMGTLLSFYEDFPTYSQKLNLNIPESGNKIPDILNEVIWNLRWMLAMQDPNDGGVYNKLTDAYFDGMEMPEKDKLPRYVVQKGTAATLDFAAVTAQASRIFKIYNRELPGLADSCLKASLKAWEWAKENPNIAYNQTEMNLKFKPEITTGGYGDRNFTDEFIWAACELYITTHHQEYYTAVNIIPDDRMPLPSWGNVRLLGYYSLFRHRNQLKGVASTDFSKLKINMISLADRFLETYKNRAYQTVMGMSEKDFGWGSNSLAANQGVALIQAYQLSGDKKYLEAALSNLDYLLGRNASGYSYVTGYGYKTPMFPHHRPSVADGVKEPIPGLLVGGPNPGMQDKVTLESSVPDEAYIDNQNSYATNEIAINWNAPLVYLSNALVALKTKF